MKDGGRRKEDRTERTGRRTEYTKDEVWNTKDGWRMEERRQDGGWRAEDGGQRMEEGGRRTEDG